MRKETNHATTHFCKRSREGCIKEGERTSRKARKNPPFHSLGPREANPDILGLASPGVDRCTWDYLDGTFARCHGILRENHWPKSRRSCPCCRSGLNAWSNCSWSHITRYHA